MRERGAAVECCVIGGGVVGLSIARELASRGHPVTVLSRGFPRESSSWAAAGILPPAPLPADPRTAPGETLTAVSDRLHHLWAAELLEETGIDNGLRRCGGLHVASDPGGLKSLEIEFDRWRRKGARCARLSAADVAALEPALASAVADGFVLGGVALDDEMQIRPPRHLEALSASCRRRGVRLVDGAAVRSFQTSGRRILAVETDRGRFSAGVWVVAAGAWSQELAPMLKTSLRTRPIRGQIVLLAASGPVITRILNRGLDYLVQRDDGRVLVGSTIEDAGFDPRTTPEAVGRLLTVARRLVPALAAAPVETAWAGLRPGSEDGLPFIGFVPGFDDAIIAAGHFRAGLHQSTGTAVLVADLVERKTPAVACEPFSLDRPRLPRSGGVEEYLGRAAADG